MIIYSYILGDVLGSSLMIHDTIEWALNYSLCVIKYRSASLSWSRIAQKWNIVDEIICQVSVPSYHQRLDLCKASLSLAYFLLLLFPAVMRNLPVGFALIKVPLVDCSGALCLCFGCKMMFTGSDQIVSLQQNYQLHLLYVWYTSCLTGLFYTKYNPYSDFWICSHYITKSHTLKLFGHCIN